MAICNSTTHWTDHIARAQKLGMKPRTMSCLATVWFSFQSKPGFFHTFSSGREAWPREDTPIQAQWPQTQYYAAIIPSLYTHAKSLAVYSVSLVITLGTWLICNLLSKSGDFPPVRRGTRCPFILISKAQDFEVRLTFFGAPGHEPTTLF
jgi:hypothetical protein